MLLIQSSKLPTHRSCHRDSKALIPSHTSPFDPNVSAAQAQTHSLNLHASVHKGRTAGLVSDLLSENRKVIQNSHTVCFVPTTMAFLISDFCHYNQFLSANIALVMVHQVHTKPWQTSPDRLEKIWQFQFPR